MIMFSKVCDSSSKALDISGWLMELSGCGFVERDLVKKITIEFPKPPKESDLKLFPLLWGYVDNPIQLDENNRAELEVHIDCVGYNLRFDQVIIVKEIFESDLNYQKETSLRALYRSIVELAYVAKAEYHVRGKQIPLQLFLFCPYAASRDEEVLLKELPRLKTMCRSIAEFQDFNIRLITRSVFCKSISRSEKWNDPPASLRSIIDQLGCANENFKEKTPIQGGYIVSSTEKKRSEEQIKDWFQISRKNNFELSSPFFKLLLVYLRIQAPDFTSVKKNRLLKACGIDNAELYLELMSDFRLNSIGKVFEINRTRSGGLEVELWEDVRQCVLDEYRSFDLPLENTPGLDNVILKSLRVEDFTDTSIVDVDKRKYFEEYKYLLKPEQIRGYDEEYSLNLEDNIFSQFYNLALVSNYKNIQDFSPAYIPDAVKRKELRNHAFKEKNFAKSLKQGIHLGKLNKIIEDFKGDSVFTIISPEEYQGCEDKGVILTYLPALETVVQTLRDIPTPSYESLWKSEDLLDYTLDCFDKSLRCIVVAQFAYRLDNHSLAWAALAKSKEFLGIYQGARVALHKRIAIRKSHYSKQRSSEDLKDSLKLKMRVLISEQLDPQENKSRPFGNDYVAADKAISLESNRRRKIFIERLSEEFLAPLAVLIRGDHTFDDNSYTDKKDRKRVEYEGLVARWIKEDEDFKTVFEELWTAVRLTPVEWRHWLMDAKAAPVEKEKKEGLICFAREQWEEHKMIVEKQYKDISLFMNQISDCNDPTFDIKFAKESWLKFNPEYKEKIKDLDE